MHLLSQPKLPRPEQPRANEDTTDDGPGTLRWDPRGRSTPIPLGRGRGGAGGRGLGPSCRSAAPASACKPRRAGCADGGARAAGVAQVYHAYLKVSLRAARSRGSSVVALWGSSEILASAPRLSWRRACCTSGFRASSKRVISKGKAVCRSHGARAQTWAQATVALPPQGTPPRIPPSIPPFRH